jgi:hypothetical protein
VIYHTYTTITTTNYDLFVLGNIEKFTNWRRREMVKAENSFAQQTLIMTNWDLS